MELMARAGGKSCRVTNGINIARGTGILELYCNDPDIYGNEGFVRVKIEIPDTVLAGENENDTWLACEGEVFVVDSFNNVANPYSTNISLKKGQIFYIYPNPVDQWCGGGSRTGLFTNHEGYKTKVEWMRMFYSINGKEYWATPGKHIAPDDGKLFFYCNDGADKNATDDNSGSIAIKVQI